MQARALAAPSDEFFEFGLFALAGGFAGSRHLGLLARSLRLSGLLFAGNAQGRGFRGCLVAFGLLGFLFGLRGLALGFRSLGPLFGFRGPGAAFLFLALLRRRQLRCGNPRLLGRLCFACAALVFFALFGSRQFGLA